MNRRAFLAALAASPLLARASEPLNAFGDSITLALTGGASSQDKGYASLVATARGMAINNLGIRGAEVADMADPVMRLSVSPWTQTIALLGYNDNYIAGSAGIPAFCDTLKALSAWLTIPESGKFRGQSPSITYTGAWQQVGSYGGAVGRVTAGHGDKATFRVTGSTIYVCFARFAPGMSGGSFALTVDGVAAGTWDCTGGAVSYLGLWYGQAIARISGLSNAEHEVVLTTGQYGAVNLLWVAGLGPQSCTVGPKLWVGNCLHMVPAGYATSPAGANAASAAAYNAAMGPAIDQLRADGLNVVLVDASAVYDPAIDCGPDVTHPTDAGHAKIAQAFISAMA